MLRCTLYILLFIIIDASSILMAQETDNHPLLPKLDECGQLNWMEFKDHIFAVKANEFPWMAHVAFIDPETSHTTYRCSAVLINKRYLLTVANCFANIGRDEAYAVRLSGSTNVSNEAEASQLLAIEEIVIHPNFNKREVKNDITLIRLNETISFTSSIRPICLPGPNIKNKEFGAEQLTVAGWYRGISFGNFEFHKLPVIVSNVLDCHRKYSKLVNITDTHMCGIACLGRDQYLSGSPLMDIIEKTNYYLAGLLAAGLDRCTFPQQPDIFTRVDRYMDWIKHNIRA